jgi:hypothetical protein
MNNTKLTLNTEIHTAEIERALDLTAQVWEMNADISIDDMCNQLDAIGNIVDGTSTFGDFCEATNLTSIEVLN